MNFYELPGAIEPDTWNVIFYPSDSAVSRVLLGRFKHVAAFGYAAGFRAWLVYDVQWGRLSVGLYSHAAILDIFRRHQAQDCSIVKVERRQQRRLGLLNRFGFYCVPAIKHLLGLSCVAVTPDGLYRSLLNNGGILIHGSTIGTTTAAAGSVAATGTANRAG